MYHYKLTFKGRGEEPLYMPDHVVERQGLQHKFLKSDEVVAFGGQIFRCSDVKRVSREWVTDYQAAEPQRVEVSDEQRAKNLRRLTMCKTYLRTHRKGVNEEETIKAGCAALPEDMHHSYDRFIRWFRDPGKQAERDLRDEFRAQHIDTYFKDADDFFTKFEAWKKHRPIDLYSEATAIFLTD